MNTKKILVSWVCLLIFSFVYSACSPKDPSSTRTAIPSPTTLPDHTQTTTATRFKETTLFPLSEPGPSFVGNREFTLIDSSRDNREIEIKIWYPALKQTDDQGRNITRDAVPDMSDAPYPLILTEGNSGNYLFRSHFASHGFVMVTVNFPEEYDNWDFGVIDHPRDILFALDWIASNPPEGLIGVIDSDRVGSTGYSWGGFYSLVLGGARIDPEFYLSQCTEAPAIEPPMSSFWLRYYCDLSSKWDDFAALAGDAITISDDDLWQPITDGRIRVIAPLAPDGAWLYGERGLAAVDRPTIIIVGTKDDISSYTLESVYIFDHLGTPNRYLISYIGKGHMMVFDSEPAARMNHFVTAFFGYYLQGRDDYLEYFSEDFVTQFDDLAWGVYRDK
jgi:predicted dienelactone hydrolase